MIKKIKYGAAGQSICDLALENYGDMDGVAMVLEDNLHLIPDASDTDGIRYKYRKDIYTNAAVVKSVFLDRKPTSI